MYTWADIPWSQTQTQSILTSHHIVHIVSISDLSEIGDGEEESGSGGGDRILRTAYSGGDEKGESEEEDERRWRWRWRRDAMGSGIHSQPSDSTTGADRSDIPCSIFPRGSQQRRRIWCHFSYIRSRPSALPHTTIEFRKSCTNLNLTCWFSFIFSFSPQPHIVINCAAISVPRACEVDPAGAMATNVPTSLVDWLSRSTVAAATDHPYQSPCVTLLIHMSTDQGN